jgi:hypothetical protein
MLSTSPIPGPIPLKSRKALEKFLGSDEVTTYDNAVREERGDPLPWFLLPGYQPHEMQFSNAGGAVVEAGTLEALVEWLTIPRPSMYLVLLAALC